MVRGLSAYRYEGYLIFEEERAIVDAKLLEEAHEVDGILVTRAVSVDLDSYYLYTSNGASGEEGILILLPRPLVAYRVASGGKEMIDGEVIFSCGPEPVVVELGKRLSLFVEGDGSPHRVEVGAKALADLEVYRRG